MYHVAMAPSSLALGADPHTLCALTRRQDETRRHDRTRQDRDENKRGHDKAAKQERARQGKTRQRETKRHKGGKEQRSYLTPAEGHGRVRDTSVTNKGVTQVSEHKQERHSSVKAHSVCGSAPKASELGAIATWYTTQPRAPPSSELPEVSPSPTLGRPPASRRRDLLPSPSCRRRVSERERPRDDDDDASAAGRPSATWGGGVRAPALCCSASSSSSWGGSSLGLPTTKGAWLGSSSFCVWSM